MQAPSGALQSSSTDVRLHLERASDVESRAAAPGRLLPVAVRNAGLWLPPGGHVEPCEHPRDTVLREAHEELGIAAEPKDDAPAFLTCTQTVGNEVAHTDVSLWYVLTLNRRSALMPDPGEFNAIHWFRFDEVPFERADPQLARFLTKLDRASRPV